MTFKTPQIVEGHKVVTNETTYVKKTRFGASVYKVRTVSVLPLDDDSVTVIKPDVEELTPTDTNNNKPPTSDDAKPETDSEANDLERGSPEVLDNTHRRNEIPKDIDEVEVQ